MDRLETFSCPPGVRIETGNEDPRREHCELYRYGKEILLLQWRTPPGLPGFSSEVRPLAICAQVNSRSLLELVQAVDPRTNSKAQGRRFAQIQDAGSQAYSSVAAMDMTPLDGVQIMWHSRVAMIGEEMGERTGDRSAAYFFIPSASVAGFLDTIESLQE